jgi:3-hydroxybutyryl-CoA dehydrogenase
VVALIINVASEIAQQGIAAPADIDRAVRLGLGYPQGPLAWGDSLGAKRLLTILERMTELTGDPRYRPGPWLRRRAALGLSLRHIEPALN